MNTIVKVILIVLIIAYCVSPIDACPGPIDDFIVILLGTAATGGASLMQRKEE